MSIKENQVYFVSDTVSSVYIGEQVGGGGFVYSQSQVQAMAMKHLIFYRSYNILHYVIAICKKWSE